MAAFAADFPGGISEPLEINYRSTQKIIDASARSRRACRCRHGMAELKLEANRGVGDAVPEIRGIRYAGRRGRRHCRQHPCNSKRTAWRCGIKPSFAGPIRGIDEIARALEARGIPVLHLGSLFEREEIRDLLSLLTLATDRFGAGLVRVCAMPRYRASLQDVKRCFATCVMATSPR